MNKDDFEKIVLTESEKDLFDRIRNSNGLELHCKDAETLSKFHIVSTGVDSTDLEGYATLNSVYSLTEDGERFCAYEKQKKKELLLGSVKIPIAVTIATHLLIKSVEWLLPLIQQWFSSSP